jgi:hypothetical protein
MDTLTVLAVQLFLFTVISWVMVRDMRHRPQGGFFRPVLFGIVPIMVLSVGSFSALEGMPASELSQAKAALAAQFSKLLSSGGAAGGFSDAELQSISELSLKLQPAAVCVFWLSLLTLSAMVIRKWLVARGQTLPAPPLSRWQAPDFLIWVLLLPAALLILNQRGWLGEVEAWMSDLSLNLVMICLFIYLFQGLMVLLDRISRLGMPKPLTVCLLLFALLFAAVPQGRGIAMAFLGLGILDTWFNFRKIEPKRGDHERSSS